MLHVVLWVLNPKHLLILVHHIHVLVNDTASVSVFNFEMIDFYSMPCKENVEMFS